MSVVGRGKSCYGYSVHRFPGRYLLLHSIHPSTYSPIISCLLFNDLPSIASLPRRSVDSIGFPGCHLSTSLANETDPIVNSFIVVHELYHSSSKSQYPCYYSYLNYYSMQEVGDTCGRSQAAVSWPMKCVLDQLVNWTCGHSWMNGNQRLDVYTLLNGRQRASKRHN